MSFSALSSVLMPYYPQSPECSSTGIMATLECFVGVSPLVFAPKRSSVTDLSCLLLPWQHLERLSDVCSVGNIWAKNQVLTVYFLLSSLEWSVRSVGVRGPVRNVSHPKRIISEREHNRQEVMWYPENSVAEEAGVILPFLNSRLEMCFKHPSAGETTGKEGGACVLLLNQFSSIAVCSWSEINFLSRCDSFVM